MLPTIGIMIGFYILTRMIEILGTKEKGTGLKIFAVITVLVTLISMASLFTEGSKTRTSLPAYRD